MNAPLIVIHCENGGGSGRFRFVDGSVESWTDSELALAVLWCIDAQQMRHSVSKMIQFVFDKISERIHDEWVLRYAKSPEWMYSAFCYARQSHPGLSLRYDQMNEDEGERRWRAIDGRLVQHPEHGIGRARRHLGGMWADIEFWPGDNSISRTCHMRGLLLMKEPKAERGPRPAYRRKPKPDFHTDGPPSAA